MTLLKDLIENQESGEKLIKKSGDQIKDIVDLKNNKMFPDIYYDSKIMNNVYIVYDRFLDSLKSDSVITKEKLESVLPEYLLSQIETKNYNKKILEKIQNFIIENIVGYGIISIIFKEVKDGLNDIIVNTKDFIDIIYNGLTYETPFKFRSEQELRKIINKMLAENNRKIDEAHPIISSKLKDGSRIEVQIPPIAANGGSCITIRKFNEIPLLLEFLVDAGQMNYKMAYYLIKVAKGKCNIVVSGGTSSGKTTFLNSLTRFVENSEQLMVIEDTKEMTPQMPCHLVRSYESRNANEEGKGAVGLDLLLRSALRSSPRRIIVGECRGPEIVIMLNAMNTGHPGSMTTVHSDSTKEAITRIENMYLEARPTATKDLIRQQITSAVDLVIQLVRFPDGTRKIVAISEIEKRIEDNGVVSMNNIFEFKRDLSDIKKTKGDFVISSTPSRTLEQCNMFGVDMDLKIFDNDFDFTREMLIEELSKDLPDKMCGWEDYFLETFLERDPDLFQKWSHFRKIKRS